MMLDMHRGVHIPVLLGEVIEGLSPQRGSRILDCTVGGGGHAKALLERAVPGGVLIGIDYDARALEVADAVLRGVERARYRLFQGPFSRLKEFVLQSGLEAVDIIFFDLGLSSIQLDDPSRGFSFRYDSFLDMRMDQSRSITAQELVNSLSEEELSWIFSRYGEERFARRIAREIVVQRRFRPIETTGDLVRIVESVVGPRRARIHPATRVFQALRIVVNNELQELEKALCSAREVLAPGGRIGVISFHSLEDRIVKHTFRQWMREGEFEILTKKPIVPQPEEVMANPRSRSAKLRIVQRKG